MIYRYAGVLRPIYAFFGDFGDSKSFENFVNLKKINLTLFARPTFGIIAFPVQKSHFPVDFKNLSRKFEFSNPRFGALSFHFKLR